MASAIQVGELHVGRLIAVRKQILTGSQAQTQHQDHQNAKYSAYHDLSNSVFDGKGFRLDPLGPGCALAFFSKLVLDGAILLEVLWADVLKELDHLVDSGNAGNHFGRTLTLLGRDSSLSIDNAAFGGYAHGTGGNPLGIDEV